MRILTAIAMIVFSGALVAGTGIKHVTYKKNGIPLVVTASGIATEIIFEEDEEIKYFTFGDEGAWDARKVLPNILVMKIKAENPETNLLLHTNKRAYVFNITVGNNNWKGNALKSKANFSVRMKYNDSKSIKNLKKRNDAENLTFSDITSKESYKYSNYDMRSAKGSSTIEPLKVWDNGILTFMLFKEGTRSGAVFEVDPITGLESTVTQHTERNGVVVLTGVFDRLMIRYGKKAVELRRNDLNGRKDNKSKTTVEGYKRVVGKTGGKPDIDSLINSLVISNGLNNFLSRV
jgi:type IV secretion system protein VirB9